MSLLRSIRKEAWDFVVSVTKYLSCLHIANTYACTLTLVSGPSMLPTLNLTGDLLLLERGSHQLRKVRPWDGVLVKSPVEPRKNLMKRVIALEGDKVTSFVDPLTSDHCQTVVVPRGHVWIQGDNLYASRDFRHYGPVPYGLVQGKVFFRDIMICFGGGRIILTFGSHLRNSFLMPDMELTGKSLPPVRVEG